MTYAEIDEVRYREVHKSHPYMMIDLIPAAMFTREELRERGFELKDDETVKS